MVAMQVLELRFVRTREEQLRVMILAACHSDPTAGHMGEKRTFARITERYMWSGIVRGVKEMVCIVLSPYQMAVYVFIYHNQV